MTIASGKSTSAKISLLAGNAKLTSYGGDTIQAGAGSLSMISSGNDLVMGGAGSFQYSGSSGSLRFIGGSGDATISSGGSNTLFVTTGSGRTVVMGSAMGLNFVAGSGSASVTDRATQGVSKIQFGTGKTTATGGSAEDIYSFVSGAGGGTDTITNFKLGKDQLSFRALPAIRRQRSGERRFGRYPTGRWHLDRAVRDHQGAGGAAAVVSDCRMACQAGIVTVGTEWWAHKDSNLGR